MKTMLSKIAYVTICAVTAALAPVADAAQRCPIDLGTSTAPATRFTVTNGEITDGDTGLIWKQCSEGQALPNCTGTATTMPWTSALNAAKDSTFAAHTEWRLPNKQELESLIDDTCISPALNATFFPNDPQAWTWTSTTATSDPQSAWVINFTAGATYTYMKSDATATVRLVRGGNAYDALAIDTTPPTAPTVTKLAPVGNVTTATPVTFTFSATDNVEVTGYVCRLDNFDPFTPCPSPSTSPAYQAIGSHTLEVRAKDAAGNVGATGSFSWTVTDGTAPQTDISAPLPGDGPNTDATIVFSGTDNVTPNGALTFTCSLDGGSFSACQSAVLLSNLAVGTHTFQVRAKDAADNETDPPASVTWQVTRACPLLDVDGGSGPTPNVDGVIIARYLLGIRGDALLVGFTQQQLGTRNTGTAVENYLANTVTVTRLDVFGRTQPAPVATTDGLVWIRWMQGAPEASLLNGITVPPTAVNGTGAEIYNALNNACATQN